MLACTISMGVGHIALLVVTNQRNQVLRTVMNTEGRGL